MHTLIVTLTGLALLGIFLGLARVKAVGALRFIPVWLSVCVLHLAYGVMVAGHGLMLELGVHAIVFGVPAATGFVLSRTLRPKG